MRRHSYMLRTCGRTKSLFGTRLTPANGNSDQEDAQFDRDTYVGQGGTLSCQLLAPSAKRTQNVDKNRILRTFCRNSNASFYAVAGGRFPSDLIGRRAEDILLCRKCFKQSTPLKNFAHSTDDSMSEFPWVPREFHGNGKYYCSSM